MKDYKIAKFDNGAVIVLKTIKNLKCSAINMGFKTGAFLDKVSGTAHFLEHNLFLGTQNRTREQIDKDNLAICSLNAATSLYYTVVKFKRANSELEEAFDFASDILLNTKFNNNELKKEREVVRNEILSSRERDKRSILAYHSALWNPYVNVTSCAILGQDIDAITKKDLEEYRKNNYIAQNFVLYAVSSLPMKKFVALYKKYIEPNLMVKKDVEPVNYNMTPQKPSKLQVVPLDQEKIDVAISINIPFGINNLKSRFSRLVLRYYLNAEETYNTLRKKGLIYSCITTISEFAYNSIMTIKYTCAKENVNKIIDEYTKEIHNLYKNGIPEEKFKTLKKQLIIAEDEKENDFVEYQASDLTYLHTLDALTDDFDYNKEAKDLKIEDVNKYIGLFNNPNNELWMTVLGNIKEEDVYKLKQVQKKFFVSESAK